MSKETTDDWSSFLGQEIVLDVSSPYVILGTLVAVEPHGLVLTEADVHDLRDSKTTRELYVLGARRLGIRRNRARVLVTHREIVCITRLADVEE